MPLWLRRRTRLEDLDPTTAVEKVLRRMRNDRTEARFQVRAAEADANRLRAQTEGSPTEQRWSQDIDEHLGRVQKLRQDLARLEEMVSEAETWAKALAARASNARARLSLGGYLDDLERGDSVDVFQRLQRAVEELDWDIAGMSEVERLLENGDA